LTNSVYLFDYRATIVPFVLLWWIRISVLQTINIVQLLRFNLQYMNNILVSCMYESYFNNLVLFGDVPYIFLFKCDFLLVKKLVNAFEILWCGQKVQLPNLVKRSHHITNSKIKNTKITCFWNLILQNHRYVSC